MIRGECRVMCSWELITTTVCFIFDLKCRSFAPHKKKKTPNWNHFFTEPNKFTYFFSCNISEHEKRRLSSMRSSTNTNEREKRNIRENSLYFPLCDVRKSIFFITPFRLRFRVQHSNWQEVLLNCELMQKANCLIIYFGLSQRSSLELDVRNLVQK